MLHMIFSGFTSSFSLLWLFLFYIRLFFQVQQSCSLNNILDLWSTLAIVRADLLLKNRQVGNNYSNLYNSDTSKMRTAHLVLENKNSHNLYLLIADTIIIRTVLLVQTSYDLYLNITYRHRHNTNIDSAPLMSDPY